MCREHDLVREREWHPARPSLSRFRHSLSLGVIVPALALMLAACKKGQTSTPSNEAPADSDTVSTSQAPPPEQVAQAPAESEAARSGEMRAETTSSGEQAKAPEPGTAESAPSQRAAVKSEGAAPARSEPVQAAAQAAPEAPAPETKAAPDTPTTGGQGQAGGEQQAAPQQASLNATPQEYQGWKNFSANCERCHGQDALGSAIAPDLRRSINQGSVLGTGKLNHDLFIGTVTGGRPAKGMPSWAQLLDRDQMESIWAYLTARAAGKLSAGRPIPQGT